MADLNALIAQGAQFHAPVDPFAQYAKMQQLQQGQQANMLNQMKMQEYQRSLEEQNRLRALDPTSADYETQLFKVKPELGIQYRKEQAATAASKALEAKNAAESAAARQKMIGQAWRDISGRPSDAQITAHNEDIQASTLFTPEEKAAIAATTQRLLSTPFEQRAAILSQQGASVGELKPVSLAAGASLMTPTGEVIATAPEKTPQATNVTEYNFAKTPEGGGFKGSFTDFIEARARAGAARNFTQLPPIAAIDPVTGKQVYVSREEAIKNRMTPVSGFEGLAPKEIQSREAKYPQATQAIKSFETNTDNFIADLQKLRDHPGLPNITGVVAGRTPSLTASGRAAQALYDKVVAKGGFAELQNLRAASPTGGALGNISNQEGQQLKSSFAAINQTQDAADVKSAIDQVITNLQGSKSRVREAYNDTYSYRDGQTKPAGKEDPLGIR